MGPFTTLQGQAHNCISRQPWWIHLDRAFVMLGIPSICREVSWMYTSLWCIATYHLISAIVDLPLSELVEELLIQH
jgi:hypothetical protein